MRFHDFSSDCVSRFAFSVFLAISISASDCSSICAQDSKRIGAIVDAAAAAFAKDTQFVGVSVGVCQGSSDFTFNYGTTTQDTATPPTDRTLYPIASITKTFTGSMLAQAAVEGKLQLKDDVRLYLKGEYPNLEFDGAPIRLCDLLNHRSGLPFMLPDKPELMPGYQNEPIAMHLQRTVKVMSTYTRDNFFTDLHLVKLSAVPGKQFKYSNAGAQLAGFLLESLYGDSFEQLVKVKIAMPLGMTDTTITLGSTQRARLAQGYDGDGTLLPPPIDELQAAGALKSSVLDLLKYIHWHLSETEKPVQLSHELTFTENNYGAGLNWQILTVNDRRLIWQEGNVPGYTCYLILEPELKLGLVILTNESDRSSSQRIASMANTILKSLDDRSVLLP